MFNQHKERKIAVRNTFDTIAGSYDLMNRIMSMGLDLRWRREAVRKAALNTDSVVLDAAAGTGDMTEIIVHENDAQVYSLDFSTGMLTQLRKRTVNSRIICGDIDTLPFPDGTFDVVTIAFGVRNLADASHGLTEFKRVLKPGGRLVILELLKPESVAASMVYRGYLHGLIPLAGFAVSGNLKAYRYLGKSVESFHTRDELMRIIIECGYTIESFSNCLFGVAGIFTCIKSSD